MLKGKVFIGTPTYRRNVVNDYCFSLVRDVGLCAAALWHIAPPHFRDDTLVHFARNYLLKTFLSTDADYLVMIDADMGWDAGGLLKLLEAPGDIVGGIYTAKCMPPQYMFNTLADHNISIDATYTSVESVATGFMRISRKAAHLMFAHHAAPFAFDLTENGDIKGEDITFCDRARQLGLSIVALLDIKFTHVGMHAWKGRFSDYMQEQS